MQFTDTSERGFQKSITTLFGFCKVEVQIVEFTTRQKLLKLLLVINQY